MAYKEKLRDINLECLNNINDLNNKLVQKVKEVSVEVVGRVKGKHARKKAQNTWWSEDI